MTRCKRSLLTAASAISVLLSAQAQAQTETVNRLYPGRLAVLDQCVFSQVEAAIPRTEQTPEFLGSLLAPLAAGFLGDLADKGISALGNAIKQASARHAFTLVGSDGYLAGDLQRWEDGPASTYTFAARPKCMILHLPSTSPASTADHASFAAFGLPRNPGAQATAEQYDDYSALVSDRNTALQDLGLASAAPATYIEIAMVPTPEGMLLRPTFVWYREALGGAGRQPREAQLLIELATPAYEAGEDGDELGSLFAVARVALPRLSPSSTPLQFADLSGLAATYYPYRDDSGRISAVSQDLTAAETELTEKRNALVTARRAKVTAERDLADEDNAANRHALEDAEELLRDAIAEEGAAEARLLRLRAQSGTANAMNPPPRDQTQEQAEEPDPGADRATVQDGGTIGATNARVSLILIREANRFWQTVGDALGAQNTAAGEAVERAISPDPDWSTERTTLLTTLLDVQAKQAAYATAVGEGDASKILDARNALLTAKAAANQAAVDAGRPLPFPGLMGEVAAGQ